MQDLWKQVAEQYHVSAEEVQAEITKAIETGMQTAEHSVRRAWAEIPRRCRKTVTQQTAPRKRNPAMIHLLTIPAKRTAKRRPFCVSDSRFFWKEFFTGSQ